MTGQHTVVWMDKRGGGLTGHAVSMHQRWPRAAAGPQANNLLVSSVSGLLHIRTANHKFYQQQHTTHYHLGVHASAEGSMLHPQSTL
jgi:hypothetical protein